MHYTEEQIYAARRVKIADILDNMNETYKRCGREYYWKKHDSVRFRDYKWYQHSTGLGGMAIDFCERFLGMNFYESLDYLYGNIISLNRPQAEDDLVSGLKNQGSNASNYYINGTATGDTETNNVTNNMDNNMTNNATNDKQLNEEVLLPALPEIVERPLNAYRYLTEKRGIDYSIVSFFVEQKDIVETKGHHNIAFIGRDQNGVARSIHLRNTNDEKKFRINVLNSDSHYGLNYFGEGEAIYAFEAPIDMLSFITLNPKNWKKNSYVALNGVSGNALYRALDEHKNLKVINLCLDNDKAGYSACESIKNELNKQGYADVIRLQSELKDWNEDLIKMRMQESSNENLYQTQEGGEEVCHQLLF